MSTLMIDNVRHSVLKFSLILLFSLILSACEEAPKAKVVKTETNEKPEKVVIPYEDYNDPVQWAEPRLQFSRDTDELGFSIYSSKLDSSDVRIAYSFQNIDPKYGQSSAQYVIRSPNNQFLAVDLEGEYVIIDLHKQSYEIIDEGYGIPSFNWTKDSNSLIFYSSGDLKRFHLKSKKLEILPEEILANQLYLLKDQKTFLSAVGRGVNWYDIKTGREVKKRIDLKPIMSKKVKEPSGIKGSDLSPDEIHLFFRNTTGIGVINVKTRKLLFHYYYDEQPKDVSITKAIFINDEELIHLERGDLAVFNIFTQKQTIVPDSYYDGSLMTLINKIQIKH